jgi:hypothetical protein
MLQDAYFRSCRMTHNQAGSRLPLTREIRGPSGPGARRLEDEQCDGVPNATML